MNLTISYYMWNSETHFIFMNFISFLLDVFFSHIKFTFFKVFLTIVYLCMVSCWFCYIK